MISRSLPYVERYSASESMHFIIIIIIGVEIRLRTHSLLN